MEKKQNWKFRIKIFLWFIFSEPFRFVKEMIYNVIFGVTKGSATKTWMIVFLVLLVFTILAENRFSAMLSLFALILLILRHIYKSGIYMFRWREVQKKKLNKNYGGKTK